MNKEKLISLNKYLQELANRLASPVTKKHDRHPETYKQFLKNEISSVQKKLDDAKLESGDK